MAPATPRSPAYISAPSTPITPTGSWRHPKMDEISRRQAENAFADSSISRVTYNAGALIASFLVLSLLSTKYVMRPLPTPHMLTSPSSETALSLASIFPAPILVYTGYSLWILRLVFLYNIGVELYKIVRPVDDFSDFALTPDQRKLLGLTPDAPLTASAMNETFATPPRYSKSTPPSRTASPLPGNSSPTVQRKAALGNRDLGLSALGMDTPTPLSSPLRAGLRPLWDTPRSASPKSGGTSSITPSNHWAYEKSILTRKSAHPLPQIACPIATAC
jgi:nucleoporin POM34